MRERNYTISAIRMICTISIVVLHIFQQYETIMPAIRVVTDWLNLGLVMFFCISAFLYSQRDITNVPKWLCRRYRELIIPSLVVGIMTLMISFLSGHNDFYRIGEILLSCLGFQVWSNDSWLFVQLWFLTYILFCYVSIPLIQKIPCKDCSELKFWTLLIGLLVFAQIATYLLESILKIQLLSVGVLLRFYLPYFLLRRYDLNGKILRKVMCALSGIAIVAVFITCACRYTTLLPLPAPIKELAFIYTQTLSGCVCFYWIYHGLSGVRIPRTLLDISDRYSYEVYLTHCLFIGYSTSVIRAFNYAAVGVCLALLLTIVTSIGVQKLAHRILKALNRNSNP